MRQDKKAKAPSLLISIGLFVTFLTIASYADLCIWFLKSVWLLCGEIRQALWHQFLTAFGEDQFTIWVAGTFFILTVEYWAIGGLYTFMDLTLKPETLRKYKIQPGTNEPLTKEKFFKLVKQVLYNQIVVGFPTVCLGGKLFMWRGPPPIRQLPQFHWVLLQFGFFLLEQEFSYYYIHRLLHSKHFYKFVHKRHHEWTSPVAISAIYCHPIEQVAANLFPIFFGCFIVNAHLTTYLSWFALAVLFTLSEHSGYHLPFMTSPEVHDYHHYRLSLRTKMSVAVLGITTAATSSVFLLSLLLSPNFRDDVLQLIKHYYVAGGDFRQQQWNKFLDYVGEDPVILWSVGSWAVLIITYWIVGGVYTFLDLTNLPKELRKYKVQPGTHEPLTLKNLFKILGLVVFNQVVVTLPMSFLMSKALIRRGSPPVRQLPPFHTTVFQIAIFVLIEEVGFYYSHRLLHHRRIYKYIHKKHHEWTAPISIVALYSHPLEHILSNLFPPFLGVFILNAHVYTAWLWFGLAIAFTLSEHSGYHLPFFPSSEAHDFHHFKFTNCFGVLGILDWLHGTDLEFRKSMSFPRHRILKGLTCARELFPGPRQKNNSKKLK